MPVLVFDTSPLSCFTRADRLGLLKQLTDGFERVTTTAVMDEISNGCALYPVLEQALSLSWMKVVPVDGLDELVAFAEYSSRLVVGNHNVGEASVLAWAEVNGGIAVMDDQTAVSCGRERGVDVKRTLALIARGVRKGILQSSESSGLVDDLIRAGARYPCTGSEFMQWASENGLLISSTPDDSPEPIR